MAEYGMVHKLANVPLQQQELHHLLFHNIGIAQLCIACVHNVSTGLIDVISLYRLDPDDAFSEEERQAFECLMPSLVEARRKNILARKLRAVERRGAQHFYATANQDGLLHAAEEGFVKLLQQGMAGLGGPATA